jgi:hypothetical protein
MHQTRDGSGSDAGTNVLMALTESMSLDLSKEYGVAMQYPVTGSLI